MDIPLGNKTLTTRPAYGDNAFAFYRMKRPDLIGMGPTEFYYWDCAKHPNGNPARPQTVTVRPNLCVESLSPLGAVNKGRTAQRKQRIARTAGLADMNAVNAAIEQVFPPLSVPVPWADLTRFQQRFSWRYIYWVAYVPMLVRFNPPVIPDSYILSVPIGVRFEAVAVWMCTQGMVFLIAPGLPVKGAALRLPAGKPTEFKREHDTAKARFRRENPRKARQLDDAFKREGERRRIKEHDRLSKDLDELFDDIEDGF